jgi:hypothetical protein
MAVGSEQNHVIPAAQILQHRLMDACQRHLFAHGELLEGERSFSEDGKILMHGSAFHFEPSASATKPQTLPANESFLAVNGAG